MFEAFIFGEIVASNNFLLLLKRSINVINPFVNMGIYLQGVPIQNIVDLTWGTNAGLRIVPILTLLTLLQEAFGSYWHYAYLAIAILSPFLGFILAKRMWGKITIFDFTGAIIYGGNTWIINRIFTGFWQLNIAYSFLPLLVVIPTLFTHEKEHVKRRRLFLLSILFALSSSAVMIGQPHFLIIISMFLISQALLVMIKKNIVVIKNLFKFYLVTGLIFLLLNCYYLIPGIFYPEITFTAPNQYYSLAAVEFNGQGAQIEKVLRLSPTGPLEKSSDFTMIELLQYLPIFLFLLFFVISKKKDYIFFGLVVVLIFLSKGLNPPGVEFSRFLYQEVFFLHYFRDSSRFISGITLFTALLISDFTPKMRIRKGLKICIAILSIVFILITNSKFLQNTKINLLKQTAIPNYYLLMQDYIDNNLGGDIDQRLLLLPSKHGIGGYSWYKNKSPISANSIFDAVIPLDMPLANGTNYPDNYSNQVSSYLYSEYVKNYDYNVLKPLGVKYILVDSSIEKPEIEGKIAEESRRILTNNKKSYSLLYEIGDLSLFKINENISMANIDKPIFAVGNFSTIAKYYASGSARPIILLNQYPNFNLIDSINLANADMLIDMDSPEFVLAAESLSTDYSLDILKAGWDYDKIFSNYEPYKINNINKSGELFTSGRSVASRVKGAMNIDRQFKNGKYKMLIKMFSDEETTLEVQIGDTTTIKRINTAGKLAWIDLGFIDLNEDANFVKINKLDSEFIAVDSMLIVPDIVYEDRLAKIDSILGKMIHIRSDDTKKEKGKEIISEFSTDRIITDSPVKYLTYRFSYGQHWISNDISVKLMGDGYGMTFINNNGKIEEIKYLPNKIYRISLGISFLVFIGSILYILIYIYQKISFKFK